MTGDQTLDTLFQLATTAMESGDRVALESLLEQHPQLVHERLESPGDWLRSKIGKALEGFFRRPFLLWFIAEDPVRSGKLPLNIAEVARTIIQKARREKTGTLHEQLDYSLRLVCWSTVASACGVQIGLIDVLLDAGASSRGCSDDALVNGNITAARHLVERGAAMTLSTALCLGRWDDATRLAQSAPFREKQFALVLSALRGKGDALRTLLAFGIDVNTRSEDLFSHGTALHHAASSGSLEAVKVLVEAGASLNARDTLYNGTPMDWADYGKFHDITSYLRERMQE